MQRVSSLESQSFWLGVSFQHFFKRLAAFDGIGGFIARSLTYFVDELDYMTFGSVSSFLARRIQCPLLILPSL